MLSRIRTTTKYFTALLLTVQENHFQRSNLHVLLRNFTSCLENKNWPHTCHLLNTSHILGEADALIATVLYLSEAGATCKSVYLYLSLIPDTQRLMGTYLLLRLHFLAFLCNRNLFLNFTTFFIINSEELVADTHIDPIHMEPNMLLPL